MPNVSVRCSIFCLGTFQTVDEQVDWKSTFYHKKNHSIICKSLRFFEKNSEIVLIYQIVLLEIQFFNQKSVKCTSHWAIGSCEEQDQESAYKSTLFEGFQKYTSKWIFVISTKHPLMQHLIWILIQDLFKLEFKLTASERNLIEWKDTLFPISYEYLAVCWCHSFYRIWQPPPKHFMIKTVIISSFRTFFEPPNSQHSHKDFSPSGPWKVFWIDFDDKFIPILQLNVPPISMPTDNIRSQIFIQQMHERFWKIIFENNWSTTIVTLRNRCLSRRYYEFLPFWRIPVKCLNAFLL